MKNSDILIVDDDLSLLRVMEHHLVEGGFSVLTFHNPIEAIEYLKYVSTKVILTDIKMPNISGIAFIKKIKAIDDNIVVIVITGFPTVDIAVEAMKNGAFDFIQKPIEKEYLISSVEKALKFFTLQNENERLRSLVAEHFEFGNIIGKSATMQNIYPMAKQASKSSATIMIQGETGTGKEVFAKAIHFNGPRKEKPFMAINCAAVPANLLESELFGHKKGTFTGAIADRKGAIELADGGTFFLDEIGDLPLELQPKILRVLQEKEIQPLGSSTIKKVDVRFIVATHKNLEEMVENGEFREDLFYRLNIIPIDLPPVRERTADIIPLFLHFLKEACEKENRTIPVVSQEVTNLLENYSWPGNVREIQNIAQRIAVLIRGETILTEHLPSKMNSRKSQNSDKIFHIPDSGIDLEEWTDKIVLEALKKAGGNQSVAAKLLGITRNTLVYRIKKRKYLQNF